MSKPVFDFPVASDVRDMLCRHARAHAQANTPQQRDMTAVDQAVVHFADLILEKLDKQATEISILRHRNVKDPEMN